MHIYVINNNQWQSITEKTLLASDWLTGL